MRPNLTQAQVNHLRRLLAWVRGEVGQTPDEIVETMRDLNMSEPSHEGKARLLECHAKAAAVPKYIRSAVKALEKLLVKQEGVVVDVAPSGHLPAEVGALPGHHPGITEVVWIGMDVGAGDDMTAGGDGWSYRAPTDPGRYLLRCGESDFEPEEVIVTREHRSGGDFLIVDCPHLGKTDLPHYHDGLTEPSWKKLEDKR